MLKYDLAEKVKENVPMSRGESINAVQAILETMKECLHTGESIHIRKFGFFKIQNKKERIGNNPNTGELVNIKARRVVKFKPSNNWINALNTT